MLQCARLGDHHGVFGQLGQCAMGPPNLNEKINTVAVPERRLFGNGETDFTISPPKKQQFSLTNVSSSSSSSSSSWLLDTRRDATKSISSHMFLFAKDCDRPITSEWQRAPYLRRCGRGLISKPTISVKKSWGGYRRMTREQERLEYSTYGQMGGRMD